MNETRMHLTGLFCTLTASVGLLIGCASASAQQTPRLDAPEAPSNPTAKKASSAESDNPFDYFGGLQYDDSIPSPEAVLGHRVGQRFTLHANVRRYLRAVAEASDRVRMSQYGRTHEGRSLHDLTISSPENLSRLDEILARNRALTDPRTLEPSRAQETIESNPAIVWFSYNVHGNEPSSSETAMQVAYTLASATNEQVKNILDKVVLVIDPMLNPDGRDRYVNWYKSVVGAGGENPNPDAAEHDEPWPGGRTNHYLFDLNRDWLWLVHPESRSRLKVYRRFRPQLHIDYHEQGHRSPYFFGAGDDPYNANIPRETREWIEKYGRANADVFDREGLVYSTKERFDYLYPGYGKVLPVYHGAVGMLTEKGGHSRAGRAIEVEDAYTLTLTDRARHHFLTSMSYLETTAKNRRGQLERFRRFFEESMSLPMEGPKAFVIHPHSDPALLKKVWDLCSAHGIEIETLDRSTEIPGLRSYATGDSARTGALPAGTWLIRADQPMGRLARAVFERDPTVTEIQTYDVTAWSLPVMFGVEAFYTTQSVDAPTSALDSWSRPTPSATGSNDPVAYAVDAAQHHFPVAVGAIVEHEMFARFAGGEFVTADGQRFSPGSLIVHTIRNEPEQLKKFREACLDAGLNVRRVGAGMTKAGHVLGANDNRILQTPKIVLARGEPISAYSFGQHWHMLDLESPVPHTVVNVDDLASLEWSDYNALVLPQVWGDPGEIFDETLTKRVKTWVQGGGVVVATGNAASWVSRNLLDLKQDDESENGDDRPAPSELTHKQREDRADRDRIPGALLRAEVDTTHPLAAGAREWIGVIKNGDRTLPVDDDGFVVARFAENPVVGGVISDRNAARIGGTPMVTHHRLGAGAVICFSDDVTFRGFNHAGMRLLMNAIVFGPSL